MFGRRLRVSVCARDIAISRNPAGWKSDMMLANSSRTSWVTDLPCIPGRNLGTSSPAGREGSRKQVVKRSSQPGSGTDPLQPAYVSARISARTRGVAPIEHLGDEGPPRKAEDVCLVSPGGVGGPCKTIRPVAY